MQNLVLTSFALLTAHRVYALNCYSCGPLSGGPEVCPNSGSVKDMKIVSCVAPANNCWSMKTPDLIVFYGCGTESDSKSCGGSGLNLQCTKCSKDLCNGAIKRAVSIGGFLVISLVFLYH